MTNYSKPSRGNISGAYRNPREAVHGGWYKFSCVRCFIMEKMHVQLDGVFLFRYGTGILLYFIVTHCVF